MELKKIEKTLVAAHSFRTTLSKLNESVGVKPDMIMGKLKEQGITPIAPQIWNYLDCDGKMDTEFTLEICVPVEQKGKDDNEVFFKELDDYSCVSHTHKGPWSEFGNVYMKLFDDLGKNGHIPTGTCREVYHHCDFEDQSKCVTEIQVEVQ